VVRYLVVTLAYASGAIRGFINKFRRTKQ